MESGVWPRATVSVLNDAPQLRRVIDELHHDARAASGVGHPPIGVLFRQLLPGERERLVYSMTNQFGVEALLEKAAAFGVDESFHYVINSRGIAHAMNRHSDPTIEWKHGQLPLQLPELARVPAAVQQRNVVAFTEVKGMPRLAYEDCDAAAKLVVVHELQRSRRWLMMKTAFKRK